MSTPDLRAKAREVDERGYCLLPAVFSADQCGEMESLLDRHWERRGKPALQGFGLAIHPLLQHVPEMAPFFAHPLVVDALREVLRDEVHLAHTGARISDETSNEAIGWHEHYAWDAGGI